MWFVSYPVVHLVAYILARKKGWYVPMLVMVWADLLVQLFAAVFLCAVIRYRRERHMQK